MVLRLIDASFDDASLHIAGFGCSVQFGNYRFTMVGKYVSIGCQTHSILKWIRLKDEEINSMSSDALDHYKKVKQTIKFLLSIRKIK